MAMQERNRNCLSAAMIVIVICCAVNSTLAWVPLLNIDPSLPLPHGVGGAWFPEDHGDGMIGWTFRLNKPVTVTQVGWYDADIDGLSRSSYQIGLWQDLTNQQFRTTSNVVQLLGANLAVPYVIIPGGTSASLNGVWRVSDLLHPLALAPGDYELGAVDSSTTTDVIMYQEVEAVSDPSLTGSRLTVGSFFYAGLTQSEGTMLHATSNLYAASGVELGPMLFIDAPEPATLSILAVGWLAMMRRRRNNS